MRGLGVAGGKVCFSCSEKKLARGAGRDCPVCRFLRVFCVLVTAGDESLLRRLNGRRGFRPLRTNERLGRLDDLNKTLILADGIEVAVAADQLETCEVTPQRGGEMV